MPVDPSSEKSIEQAIEQAMLRDRYSLRREWRATQRRKQTDQLADRRIDDFQKALHRSMDRAESRAGNCPVVVFDQDLPILERREEIAMAIRDHQVVVISGETGSGKSTQLPKICLEAGLGTHGLIGHTQPRRIAARTIATRVADELQVQLGAEVGFKIRFTDKTNPSTYIKLMTDGILLAETQGDRFLDQYSVLIIDEAHERSLNVDFLLGYLKRLLPNRPELRLIITSATIDAERFSQHFVTNDRSSKVIGVSGRTYPVELRYRPLEGDQHRRDPRELDGIVAAVHELSEAGRGDVLVFLPTERDIREAARRLRGERIVGDGGRPCEVLPLYARLSSAEQNRVFQPSSRRRIVLATNVAESSLTVPGIRYVIDTGTARMSRYAPRSKVQRLPIESISQASADQRKGRCGRVADGICIRLFGEEDYENRSRFTTPEIQRTNLAAVILRSKALQLGPVDEFPFLDPPRPETVKDGYRTLFEIGAVDERRELTAIGRRLSRLPVDPRIGRIVLAGDEENCLHEILIVAAALEIQDPRDRPYDRREAADEAHARFADDSSDFVSYLRIWDFYHEQKRRLSRNQLRRACLRNFLSYNRLREWAELHRQLLKLAAAQGMKPGSRGDDTAALHRALLAGFLSGVAYRGADVEYTGAGGVKFFLWPGSGVLQKKPKWSVVAEIVETTRRYGRNVAEINPNWLLPLSEHLVKRSYSDPHYHFKSGSVMAYERVTLYGLPIIARRRASYGHVDPVVAREVFIRDGLASPELDITDTFYVHNQRLLRRIGKQAAKARRSQYLVDPYTVAAFYEARLPSDVVDLASLRRWLKAAREDKSQPLHMEMEDLVQLDMTRMREDQFPDQLQVASMELPLEYAFAPGDEADGVSLTVPEDALGHLDPGQLGWMVPGLLEEKIVALIRSLPKSIRRALIPAPDTARRVAAELSFGQGDFLSTVAAHLTQVAQEPVRSDNFQLDKLPAHLHVHVRVIDSQGAIKAEGRDVRALRKALGVKPTQELAIPDDDTWHRDDITSWDFGDVGGPINLSRGSLEVPAYPTVVDAGESVQLRLLTSRASSRRQSHVGIRRLYAMDQRKQLRNQVNWIPELDQLSIHATGVITADDLKRDVGDLLAELAFMRESKKLPRSAEEFQSRLENSAERIGAAAREVARVLPKVLRGIQEVRLAVEGAASLRFRHAVEDVNRQFSELTRDGFLVRTPWRWLREYPRYFSAIGYRLERLAGGSLSRDQEATHVLAGLWQKYQERQAQNDEAGRYDAELEMYRWMLEEYRVSLFAQLMGTIFSVSPQRLEKQWQKVGTNG